MNFLTMQTLSLGNGFREYAAKGNANICFMCIKRGGGEPFRIPRLL